MLKEIWNLDLNYPSTTNKFMLFLTILLNSLMTVLVLYFTPQKILMLLTIYPLTLIINVSMSPTININSRLENHAYRQQLISAIFGILIISIYTAHTINIHIKHITSGLIILLFIVGIMLNVCFAHTMNKSS